MNRYEQSVDINYQPLTMQELAMAPAYLRQQHDQMDEMALQEAMANSQRLQEDDEAVNNYWNNYRTNINTISDELGNKGFTRDLARKLRTVKQQKEMDMQGGLPGIAQANYQAYLKNVEEEKKRLDKGDITQEQFNRGIRRARELYGQQGAAAKGVRYNPYSAANYVDIEKRMIEMGKNMTPQEIIAQNPNLVPSGRGYYVSKTTGRKYMPAEAIRETLMGLVINDPNINAYLNDVHSLGLLGNIRDENGNIRSMTPQEHLFQKANAVGQLLQRNDISETYKHMQSDLENKIAYFNYRMNYAKSLDDAINKDIDTNLTAAWAIDNQRPPDLTDKGILDEKDELTPRNKILYDGQPISKQQYVDLMMDNPKYLENMIYEGGLGFLHRNTRLDQVTPEEQRRFIEEQYDKISKNRGGSGMRYEEGTDEFGITIKRYTSDERKQMSEKKQSDLEDVRNSQADIYNMIFQPTNPISGSIYGNHNSKKAQNNNAASSVYLDPSSQGAEYISQEVAEEIEKGNTAYLQRRGGYTVKTSSKGRQIESGGYKNTNEIFSKAKKKGDIKVTKTSISPLGGTLYTEFTIGDETYLNIVPVSNEKKPIFDAERKIDELIRTGTYNGEIVNGIFVTDTNIKGQEHELMSFTFDNEGNAHVHVNTNFRKNPNNPNQYIFYPDKSTHNISQPFMINNPIFKNTPQGVLVQGRTNDGQFVPEATFMLTTPTVKKSKDGNNIMIVDSEGWIPLYERGKKLNLDEHAKTMVPIGTSKFKDNLYSSQQPKQSNTNRYGISTTIPVSYTNQIQAFDDLNNE